MAATYEPIATTTLGSAASSITFSSIPNTWTDLRMVIISRSTRAVVGDDFFYIRFNSDSNTNYSGTALKGNGTSASSSQSTNSSGFGGIMRLPADLAASNLFAFHNVDIFSYSGSTYKTGLINQNLDTGTDSPAVYSEPGVKDVVALWRSTSAITSIAFGFGNADLKAGTTATLYGIKNA